jgi:hypothetical protein
MPERLTIDQTVAIDFLDPEAERRALAVELSDLFERGEIELAAAPQGYRLERRGDLSEQIPEAFGFPILAMKLGDYLACRRLTRAAPDYCRFPCCALTKA